MKQRGKYDDAFDRLKPMEGVCHDQKTLAAMVGCTRGYIAVIEQAAFKKIRAKLLGKER